MSENREDYQAITKAIELLESFDSVPRSGAFGVDPASHTFRDYAPKVALAAGRPLTEEELAVLDAAIDVMVCHGWAKTPDGSAVVGSGWPTGGLYAARKRLAELLEDKQD